jgi:hypothetical protein
MLVVVEVVSFAAAPGWRLLLPYDVDALMCWWINARLPQLLEDLNG